MRLSEKQQQFSLAIAQLILRADVIGVGLTFADAYRNPRLHGEFGEKKAYGEAFSCHKVRLAVDFNAFKDGKLASLDVYDRLHDIWDTLGGAKRIEADLNHFSFEHQGHR